MPHSYFSVFLRQPTIACVFHAKWAMNSPVTHGAPGENCSTTAFAPSAYPADGENVPLKSRLYLNRDSGDVVVE